jgi:hypothetical protein
MEVENSAINNDVKLKGTNTLEQAQPSFQTYELLDKPASASAIPR